MTELAKNFVCASCGCLDHDLGNFNSVSVNDPSLSHLQVDSSLISFNFITVGGADGQHNDGARTRRVKRHVKR